MKIRDRIKYLCITQNWTMKDLAKQLNISENYLYKLISGKRCSVKRLKEIEKILSTDLPIVPSLFSQLKEKCYRDKITLLDFAKRNNITLSYLYDILSGRRKSKRIEEEIYEYIHS